MYVDPKLSPDPHTKNRPPRFFPPHEPRDAKIIPQAGRSLYEKSRQASGQAYSAYLHLPRRPQMAFSQLWRLLCLFLLPLGANNGRWSREVWAARPRYLTSKPCFPRSGTPSLLWWARLLGARRLLSARAGLVTFGLLQRTCGGNRSPVGLLISGQQLGSVDRWLCQTFHQIFGDGSVKYPRLRVDLARVLSS